MISLEEKIKKLPPDLQVAVEHFIDLLMKERTEKPVRKLNLDWAGGLKDLKNKYSSVELQKKL